MTQPTHITEIEEMLRGKHNPEERKDLPSNAVQAPASERVNQLVLPRERRGKLPLTKEKYAIREDPRLIEWERVTRQFLRELSTASGHRISAVMVYEWATGINVAELMAEGGSANADLRRINTILTYHFGDSYQTWIGNKKVGKCYKVPPGWFVKRHRPLTLSLWIEYREGTLKP